MRILCRNLLMSSKTFISPIKKSQNNIIQRMINKSALCSNCIQIANSKTEESKKKKKNNINDYMNSINPKSINKIIQNYLSLRTRGNLYLINAEIAKQFVDFIIDDLLKNATHVIELNPGLGYLTKELLKAGVPFVHMYENESAFNTILEKLCQQFPKQLSKKNANLFDIAKMMYSASFTTGATSYVFKLFDNVQRKQWEDTSCMQLVGITDKREFITHLILSTVFQTCLMAFGRTILYLAMKPSVWKKFTCSSSSRMTSAYVMFQIIFDYQMFGTLDRKAFVPWKRKMGFQNNDKHKFYEEDSNFLYVVKLEPKPDLLKTLGGKQDLIYFWHFTRRNLYKLNNRVIPTLEKIIPGCGLRLIEKNFNIFTQFDDLTPHQILDLFLEFRSWPEFKESIFVLGATDSQTMYNTDIYK
ncbi:dimethyladenosine transferase 2, mitochondrial-like isoform X1 [Hylaeus anthracinus]|uniref:dimethyladenosine transferase 2, mitochondrial-like isoform X1 n=3 Tax=Hylaeus anthracinus TaxID=313031 RepID=UPI0023BA383A|nr:dimethyladenosine transferase 2, mitochondrial-like isoform X1 [Hylaeus anthracinus]XP_054010254.1 dimethyladenosine transferase 2, mitochondrial-like isoform X1 [Hylaeus anthracinus]